MVPILFSNLSYKYCAVLKMQSTQKSSLTWSLIVFNYRLCWIFSSLHLLIKVSYLFLITSGRLVILAVHTLDPGFWITTVTAATSSWGEHLRRQCAITTRTSRHVTGYLVVVEFVFTAFKTVQAQTTRGIGLTVPLSEHAKEPKVQHMNVVIRTSLKTRFVGSYLQNIQGSPFLNTFPQ